MEHAGGEAGEEGARIVTDGHGRSAGSITFRLELQQRVPRPCHCVLCRDRAGNLTLHPRFREIKIPALSQKTRQERGTLED